MARVDRFQFKGFTTKEDVLKFEKERSLNELPVSTYDALVKSTEDNPNEIALSYFMLGGEYKTPFDFTYTEILEKVNKTISVFRSNGLKRGDVIALLLPNLPETCYAMVAAQSVGIAFAMNPLLSPEHLKELLLAANVKAIITIGPFVKTDVWEKIDAIRNDIPSLKLIYQVDMNQYLRGPKKAIVGLILKFRYHGKSSDKHKLLSFSKEVESAKAPKVYTDLGINSKDAASYFHTGGTTGRPKIAIQSQENICFNAWSAGGNLDTSMKTFNVYGALPLFHVFGAMITLNIAWAGSGRLILVTPKGFRGHGVMENFWKTIEHYQINIMAAVPAIYKMLDDVPMEGNDATSVKFALSGAAPLPVEVMRSFEAKSGVKILEGYGSTEGTCICSVNPPFGERKPGSVGFPIPFSDIKVFNLADEKVSEAKKGESGVVGLSGPNVFQGYLEEIHNKDIWIDYQGKKYFNTGDLGRFDEDDYLFLVGRKKELIIRGGHNIDPRTIEEPMYKLEGVEMVAAIGRPDKRVGEVPVLYVQLNNESSLTKSEIMNFATANISEKAAIPKDILIIDEIPLTTIGKIFKPELCLKEIESICCKELNDSIIKRKLSSRNSKKYGFQAVFANVSQEEKTRIENALKDYSFKLAFED